MIGDSPLFGDTYGDGPPVIDPSGGAANTQNTYLLPGAGSQVVNPTIATGNGIVQMPVTSPGSRTRFQKLPAGAADSCGSTGLSGFGTMDPAVFAEHFGHAAPDPATCLQIQCGTLSQANAGMPLVEDCANFGYSGVKACTDPACDCPPAPTPKTLLSAAPPSAPPHPPAGYITPRGSVDTPCGGYAASSALPMLQDQVGRGMGACCQSGYQQYQSDRVAGPDNSGMWWIVAGAILLMLTPSGARQ